MSEAKVFISHAYKDRIIVDAFVELLTRCICGITYKGRYPEKKNSMFLHTGDTDPCREAAVCRTEAEIIK